jgi:hypothetical protein
MTTPSSPRAGEAMTEAGREVLQIHMDGMTLNEHDEDEDVPCWLEGRILAIEAEARAGEAEGGVRQQVVREIRGRLFEAAWRRDGKEWLDPKVTSRILDEVEAALASPEPD